MDAKEYLQELEVPDRTISGRKPKGQMPEYRGSLIELLEEYHKAKVKNLGLFDVRQQSELLIAWESYRQMKEYHDVDLEETKPMVEGFLAINSA